ncbi:hypothetical protein TPB0596_12850 [Tsukamurella pulmonis]|nr:hypothetical protein TPB0596_12850 [Tsukamurella pulmonis]
MTDENDNGYEERNPKTMTDTSERGARLARLFDIRNVVGALLGLYGLGLLIAGLFPGLAEAGTPGLQHRPDVTDLAAGSSANLWVGAALVLCGIAFVAWAVLRPARASTDQE